MIYDWFKNLHFAYPYLIGITAVIPLMIWWYVYRTNRGLSTFTVSSSQSFREGSWKSLLRHVPFIFRMLAILCLILALMRPQYFNDEQISQGEGIDIVLCIDVSGSMLSTDFAPNRLEAAKQVADEFIRSRPVDRIGLVVFSGESFTQCPITTDKNTLLEQVNGLRSGMLKDGTLIGEGLATSVNRLMAGNAKSKVVILLTDGKEEPPDTRLIDPLSALEIAKSQNVKVYTIGMAREGFLPVAEEGTNRPRTPAKTFLDEALLERIASETGGQYFRARDKTSLKEIYDQIDRLEKSKVEVQALRHYEEKFVYFLFAAILFIALEWLLRLTILRKFP